MKRTHLLFCIVYCLLSTVFLWGCGAGGGGAPPGSTITADLERPSVTGSATTRETDQQNLTITVTDPSGGKVKDAEVQITVGFTTSPAEDPSTVLTLCGGAPLFNSDGGRSANNPITMETGAFGVVDPKPCFQFQKGGGLSYTAVFTVHMGSETAQTTLTVN